MVMVPLGVSDLDPRVTSLPSLFVSLFSLSDILVSKLLIGYRPLIAVQDTFLYSLVLDP